jgi:small subunit ribosomal protein S9
MPKSAKPSVIKDSAKPARKPGRPKKAVAKDSVVAPNATPVVTPIELVKPKLPKKLTYLFAVGRRKTAIARVRWHKKGTGIYQVNGHPVEKYFNTLEMLQDVKSPLDLLSLQLEGDITVRVSGGGKQGQAGSVRHGLARVLVKLDPEYRTQLKQAGYLKRDPRAKERKKYGLKRARRAPQWQKR